MPSTITAARLAQGQRLDISRSKAGRPKAINAKGRLVVRAYTEPGKELDLGQGKASSAFKDMKNAQESYDEKEVDEPTPDPPSSDVAMAPESGTERPSREHSDSYRQYMAKEAHQEENEFAAPESGDIRDETSGRGHV